MITWTTHFKQPRGDLLVSVSASHVVSRGFASRRGHTKDHYKENKLTPCWERRNKGSSLTVQPYCIKG